MTNHTEPAPAQEATMVEQIEAEKVAQVAQAICAERCAQCGDPPCSAVCDKGHCDECLGMAAAALRAGAEHG